MQNGYLSGFSTLSLLLQLLPNNNNRGLVSNKYLYKATGVNGINEELVLEYKYTYDSEDNVTKVETKTNSSTVTYDPLVSYAYDNMNNVTSETRDNVTTTYTYNLGNLVTNMTNKKGSSILSKYDYTYNYDGNVATKYSNGYTSRYTYDPMNRLIHENNPYASYEYEYDAAGNRIRVNCTASEDNNTIYRYDKNNRLIEEDKTYPGNDEMFVTKYYYDKNGNTRTKTKGRVYLYDGLTPTLGINTESELSRYISYEYFTYNVFNQLTEYKTKGKTATYTYLPNGYRNSKNVNGIKTNFVWDGDNIALETDSNYNTTNILFRGRNLISDSKGNNYVYDNHGDVTSVLNNSGTTTKKYEYNAFGVVDDETNINTYNPWQYCSEYRDEESGLIYLRNRYYDSDSGRFINEDNYWETEDIINADYELETQFANMVIKRKQIIQNYIESIYLRTNITSYEKIIEIVRWQLGQLSNKEKQWVQNAVDNINDVSIENIRQSSNLYNYCINNPVLYNDLNGNFAEVAAAGCAAVDLIQAAIIAGATIAINSIDIETDNDNDDNIYYEAWIANGSVQIGDAITFEKAVSRVSLGGSVYCISMSAAYVLAKTASAGREPLHHNPHGSGNGYKPHYHLSNHSNSAHIWYN